MNARRWQRGDIVAVRSVSSDGVGYTYPGFVVADEEFFAAVFQPCGTVCKRRTGPRGGPTGRLLLEWDGGYADRVWTGPATLRLHVVGFGYSVLRDWQPVARRYEGWYVNLEAPWRRTSIGFDTRDHVLDITVAHDLSTWNWKDADEFAWSRRHGRIDGALAVEIVEAARDAVSTLQGRDWPFHPDWDPWRPDPAWTMAVLPPGWDQPGL